MKRNEACWCNSGLKYKNCHLEFDEKLQYFKNKGFIVPSRKLIKTPLQIEGIKKCSIINNALLDLIESTIKEGMSTDDINTLAHNFTISQGAYPADLNYHGFPKSICISVNDVVCHGVPRGDVILNSGDIVNVDSTIIFDGYYADASRMFTLGDISPIAKKLVQTCKECLDMAVDAIVPWKTTLGDIGHIIQSHAEKNGFPVVREFGGHGVGLAIHEEPFISHVGTSGFGMLLVPGMVFTIEPIINAGSSKIYVDASDGWTVRTWDSSLSAQWEYTLLVTETGVEILSS